MSEYEDSWLTGDVQCVCTSVQQRFWVIKALIQNNPFIYSNIIFNAVQKYDCLDVLVSDRKSWLLPKCEKGFFKFSQHKAESVNFQIFTQQ